MQIRHGAEILVEIRQYRYILRHTVPAVGTLLWPKYTAGRTMQVVMMGFSMGGYVTAAFAAAHPESPQECCWALVLMMLTHSPGRWWATSLSWSTKCARTRQKVASSRSEDSNVGSNITCLVRNCENVVEESLFIAIKVTQGYIASADHNAVAVLHGLQRITRDHECQQA